MFSGKKIFKKKSDLNLLTKIKFKKKVWLKLILITMIFYLFDKNHAFYNKNLCFR